MSAKIVLTINGKRQELDAAEARRLFDELRAFLGEAVVVQPQYPVIVIDQTPPPKPQIWPFSYPYCTGDPLPFPGSTCQSRS